MSGRPHDVRSTRSIVLRKTLIACVATVLVLAGGLIALLGPRHCPVNRAAFERIAEGMTPTDVEAILGGPQGDYRTRPSHPVVTTAVHVNIGMEFHQSWVGDEGTVCVTYVEPRPHLVSVTRVSFEDATPHAPGIVELARWRLRKLGALLP
jgi:hypothetical protein